MQLNPLDQNTFKALVPMTWKYIAKNGAEMAIDYQSWKRLKNLDDVLETPMEESPAATEY